MSEYSALTPVFASSTMFISKEGHFRQIIKFDYEDQEIPKGYTQHAALLSKNYYRFLQSPENLSKELSMYANNLQAELNSEVNAVNGQRVDLHVIHCDIHFRTVQSLFVQWIVEFEGEFHNGPNEYENHVEPAVLEYPISSVYYLDEGLTATKVISSLKHQILPGGHVVLYSGERGMQLTDYEMLQFIKSVNGKSMKGV